MSHVDIIFLVPPIDVLYDSILVILIECFNESYITSIAEQKTSENYSHSGNRLSLKGLVYDNYRLEERYIYHYKNNFTFVDQPARYRVNSKLVL